MSDSFNPRKGVLMYLSAGVHGCYHPRMEINDEAQAEKCWRENAHNLFGKEVMICVMNAETKQDYRLVVSLEDFCQQILRNLEEEE